MELGLGLGEVDGTLEFWENGGNNEEQGGRAGGGQQEERGSSLGERRSGVGRGRRVDGNGVGGVKSEHRRARRLMRGTRGRPETTMNN